jgi:hypothetical protein
MHAEKLRFSMIRKGFKLMLKRFPGESSTFIALVIIGEDPIRNDPSRLMAYILLSSEVTAKA